MDTFGSNFDTVLAVYTGTDLGSLAPIACNDDAQGTLQSQVEFQLSPGTTYWIQAGGWMSDAGDLSFHVVVSTADVSVAVADSADPVAIGDAFTYTVTVDNAGPATATNASALTFIGGSASRTINSASGSQGSCSIVSSTVDCSLGDIPASGSATVTISVTASSTGTVSATSQVSADTPDLNNANNSDEEFTTITNPLGCTIIGTNGNDTLTGTNGDDVICGLAGDDTIAGHNGLDTIYGGPGNDLLQGQNGNDTIVDHDGKDTVYGGNGDDTIDVQDGAAGDTANGDLGDDTCLVDAGDATNSC